jgi:hypothetical protein
VWGWVWVWVWGWGWVWGGGGGGGVGCLFVWWGSGAFAGNHFLVDRQFIARELGMVGGLCPNSMDAVSDRECLVWGHGLGKRVDGGMLHGLYES